MVLSMTGFSSLIITLPTQKTALPSKTCTDIQMTMTLKSLNSRFFEANCKLPYSLAQLETDIIKQCKAKLYRGNIYFTIHMHNPSALTAAIQPSLNTVSGYIKALENIKHTFSLEGNIALADIISLPNIFETCEQPLSEEITTVILQAADQLITTLSNVRLKEGQLLAQDLHQRIKSIKQYLEQLEPRAAVVMEQKKQQLFSSLQALIGNETQATPSEMQCISLYNQLDKVDIHEEIVRFKMHLDALVACIDSADKEKGKKLDFILQELFREINTIASKCSDALISSIAINVKVELEKAREQAQNIV
jgi:uncharacterized protein (TIGR00255 family)